VSFEQIYCMSSKQAAETLRVNWTEKEGNYLSDVFVKI